MNEPEDGQRNGVVLRVSDLNVTYGEAGSAVQAVTEVDLEVRRGEIVGIVGESGSGKSTLLNAMARLLREPGRVDSGTVRFIERDGAQIDVLELGHRPLAEFRWARLSVVFQSALNALNPVLSIRAQLEDVLRTHRPQLRKAARLERCEEVMRMVGVPTKRLDSFPHQLSGGMRQRVMIAMALILEPDVVLMDEPTTALDVVTQRQIMREILRLRDEYGFAIVMVTHDLSLLLEIADRISVMYAGRIVESGSARDLLDHHAHPYTMGLIDSFPPLKGERRELTGIPGSPPDLSNLPMGCSFAPRCPFVRADCVAIVPELMEIGRVSRAQEVACHLNDEHGLNDDQRSGRFKAVAKNDQH